MQATYKWLKRQWTPCRRLDGQNVSTRWTEGHHNHLKPAISIFQLVAACAWLVAKLWLLLAPHVLIILSHEHRHTVTKTPQLSTAVTLCAGKKDNITSAKADINLVSFPGLPTINFLIACSMQKQMGGGLVHFNM